MSFQAIIGTLASIVSIVGGVVAIISAVSKEPIFTRLWQQQPRRESQPALQPSPSLAKPMEKVAPSTQKVPPGRWKLGLSYGVISGILAVLILIPALASYQHTNFIIYNAFIFLAFSAWGILSIADGLLPSRVSGSVLSAAIAGGMLGAFIFLASLISDFFMQQTISGVDVLYFVLFGVTPFIISVLFGLVGRYLYKRVQVSQ
jgi:hypothetical protein